MKERLRTLARDAGKRLLRRVAPPEVMAAIRHTWSRNAPVFPTKNVVVADVVRPGRTLVLAPHPDDEVIGAGGALALELAAGSRVTVLYVTDGGGLDPSGDRQLLVRTRRAEASQVGERFEVQQVFWDEPDTGLTDSEETVARMSSLLAETAPDRIYVPSFFDHHFDHFATVAVLAGALRRTPDARAVVHGYEVWDNIPFPNFVLDVSAAFEQKLEMLSCYRTPLIETDFERMIRSRGALLYMLHVSSVRRDTTNGYAEAFHRFEAPEWLDLYDDYVAALRARRHPILSHLSTG